MDLPSICIITCEYFYPGVGFNLSLKIMLVSPAWYGMPYWKYLKGCNPFVSLKDILLLLFRGGRVVRRCWVNFQRRGVLLIWMIVGQGPIALAVGAGGGCLDIFSLIYHFSFLSPSLWETARYRLKYCLKGPLSPKQPTNQTIKQKIFLFQNQTDLGQARWTNQQHQFHQNEQGIPCPLYIQYGPLVILLGRKQTLFQESEN